MSARPLLQTPALGFTTSSFFPVAALALIAALVLAADPANAERVVSASPDITIEIGASVVSTDGDVVVDNQLGIVALEDLGVIPDASDVVALAIDANGDRLVAFDTTTPLAGGLTIRPGDVVRYDGALYTLEFDAAANGLPNGVITDAVALASPGLLLSFDTTVDLGSGVIAADEDLVHWNGASYSLAFDGSAAGLDTALDIDGAQDLGGAGFLMSFDTTGEIAGLTFDDEDIIRFDGSLWSLEFDASLADSNWAAADMNAVMVPEASQALMLSTGILGLLWLQSRARGSHKLRIV